MRYGLKTKAYHEQRKQSKSVSYRLIRRTKEVIRCISEYYSKIPDDIIDLGTADGLMLKIIKNRFPNASCIGIEYSWELAGINTDSRITIVNSDVNFLPVRDKSFDIAIATAIIEHIPNPKRMLEEAKRVLRLNGLIIVTSPDPFWEKVATIVGHLPDEQHCNVMNLKELSFLICEVGFEILEKRKFMLSPVGMPLEIPIENAVRSIGLNFLFANQLVVGKKVNS